MIHQSLEAIIGCPLEVICDEEQFLANDEYLRALLAYFPHLPTNLITKTLFGKDSATKCFTRIRQRLTSLDANYTGDQKKEHLFERAAFVGWATDDPDQATAYIKAQKDFYTRRTNNLPHDQTASAPGSQPGDITKKQIPTAQPDAPAPVAADHGPYTPGKNRNTLTEVTLYGKPGEIFRALSYIAEHFQVDVNDVKM